MGRKTRLTPTEFRRLYPPLVAQGLSRNQIAKKLGISYRTLLRYLQNPEYVADVSKSVKILTEHQTFEDMNHSGRILAQAHELHVQAIENAIAEGDFEKARRISLDALQIARTEAQIKRVFMAVQINVGDSKEEKPLTETEEWQEFRECFVAFLRSHDLEAAWAEFAERWKRQREASGGAVIDVPGAVVSTDR